VRVRGAARLWWRGGRDNGSGRPSSRGVARLDCELIADWAKEYDLGRSAAVLAAFESDGECCAEANCPLSPRACWIGVAALSCSSWPAMSDAIPTGPLSHRFRR
jgi:hypothetical protein